jgi:hypothetical protein
MRDNHDSAGTETTTPDIVVGVEAHAVIDQAVKALADDPSVYQRGSFLVRVVRDASPAADENGIRRPMAPRIDRVPMPTLLEKLTASANWWERDAKGRLYPTLPPHWCVAGVDNRAEWPGVRHLEGVVEYPVLRPDGTLLLKPGYDSQTCLLFEPGRGVHGKLKMSPGLADAKKAVGAIREVVRDFPWQEQAHFAAYLAGLLTPLARFAFEGPSPLFLVDSNVRGAGKGLLLHTISHIVTGERFTVASYTRDSDELRKRITSLALAGDRLVLFDNLAGTFGDAVLDAALTATSWSDRLLGANRMTRVPLSVVWFATGNNVSVGGDTARRTCHIRLESEEEKPEVRSGFLHPDLLGWVKDNRGRLLAHALTIAHAYCLAGRPDLGLPPWGSFEGWSGLVRQAVVWAGLPDPAQTRLLLEESADTTAQSMTVILRCLRLMDPDRLGLLAAEVIHNLYKEPPNPPPGWHQDLKEALEMLLGRPDARGLGDKLRRFRRRVFGGLYVDYSKQSHHAVKWVVRDASDFRGGQGGRQPGQEG